VTEVLRNGVLDGVAVCVAGATAKGAAGAADGATGAAAYPAAEGTAGGTAAAAVAARCAALGAAVAHLDADLDDEEAVIAATEAAGPIDVVVCDAAPAFRAAGAGVPGLRAAVDGTWNAVRAVVASRWAGDDGENDGGKVVLVAPPADAGEAAAATGAALENAARTLSVEWARFGVRVVALRPAADSPDEIAELVAFLASPGGDYFSGCAFSLR